MLGFTALSTTAISASKGQALSLDANASLNQADNTVASSTNVNVSGNLSQTQNDCTVTASATTEVRGTATNTQASNTGTETGTVQVRGNLTRTQANQTSTSSTKVEVRGNTARTQANQTTTSATTVQVRGNLSVTQDDNGFQMKEPTQVYAPSFGSWTKTQNAKKPKAPKLPDPVERGELVIDEAVLQQMEIDRLNALVLKGKQEAADRVEKLREVYWVEDKARPRQAGKIVPRFNPHEQIATPEARRQVISLFREPPQPKPMDPIRGSITPRALGARFLPKPEISKTRTIVLRAEDPRHHTKQFSL